VSLTETSLTGKPDAGNPPVRFGGRGSGNAALPTPIKNRRCAREFRTTVRSSSRSRQSSNDVRRVFHQLAERRRPPGGKQQQGSQREAHRRDVAGGNRFEGVLVVAWTEQQSSEFVQHAAEDEDERHQH